MLKIALKSALTAVMSLWLMVALAQQMEIIELRSKTVEQVLPALLPLVESGGTLTGMNNQLFLKASPRNRADIKRALAAMDTPSRRLIIRVTENRQADSSGRGVAASGQVVLGSTRRADVGATVWDSKSVRGERAGQMVQTIDGGQAFIQIGRSLPLPMRQMIVGPGGAIVNETVVYRDIGRGFYASPRVNGQRVTLEISQQSESLEGNQPHAGISQQRLATTVSGQLGEWIELGGGGRQSASNQGGSFSISTSDARDNRAIWLMVEEIE